jgi:NADH-quinone oxidoreductase subunit C
VSVPAELADRPVLHKLQAFNPRALVGAAEFRGQLSVETAPDLIREVCDFLRCEPELSFDFLADVTAVDRYPLEPRFEVVYQLLSLRTAQRLRLKARLPGSNPRIDSIVGLWPAADMLEREVFDLFGVHFSGHPDLKRLLMPEDWEGHPLRKDYPVEGYR